MPSASPPSSSPHRKLWEEKNPWVAGILAYLIPGAGHFYQGRVLKGVIYSVSILGLFFWGQKLGGGMVVNNTRHGGYYVMGGYVWVPAVSLSHLAQLGAGASALPGVLQNLRADSSGNAVVSRLTSPLKAEFQGHLGPYNETDDALLVGTIQLKPVEGQFGPEVRGTFEGTLDGQPAKLTLGGHFKLDKPIKAGFRRILECDVIDEGDDAGRVRRSILGSIPRPLLNAYGAPPDPEQIQDLYEDLGTIYDLALVFTWIAGLLNVLAVWDCVCGPAYGFGDEHARESARADPAKTSDAPPAGQQPSPGEGSPPEPPRTESRPPQKAPV